MRMWMVDPVVLCRKHLLGEHVELHMFAGTINQNKSLTGYREKGLVEIHNINNRHSVLVKEMQRRDMNHKSPLPDFEEKNYGVVDSNNSYNELYKRCEDCRGRIEAFFV